MKKGFLTSTPPRRAPVVDASPSTSGKTRVQPSRILDDLNLNAACSDSTLVDEARLETTSVALRDHGYAVLPIFNTAERSAVQRAEEAAAAEEAEKAAAEEAATEEDA